MKNILMVTSLYPSIDNFPLNNTLVCHYFVKQWQSQGYNCKVIYNYNRFLLVLYPFIKLLKHCLAALSGDAVSDKYFTKTVNYCYDGVNVSRIPIFKLFPKSGFLRFIVDKQVRKIIKILGSEGFMPDVILGHFLHPTLEIVSQLKAIYDVPTAISLHGKAICFDSSISRYINSIDLWGYRSKPIGRSFEALYGQQKHFYCFSGVPEEYIATDPKQFHNGINNFIFIGNLIKRKHPACIIPAVVASCHNKDFLITYVGNGSEDRAITKNAKQFNIQKQVVFTGRLRRDEIPNELDKADVFIMLSTNETFGLVYLEAMSRGCIVIASKNEGMDGIIKHGVNGFLCEAGNSVELSMIITNLNNMTNHQLQEISKQALDTATKMTDKKVAMAYIESIDQYLSRD